MRRKKNKFWSRYGKLITIVVVLLIAIRVALPYIILHYANKTLAGMKGYYGHINDVDVALIRGAYQLDSFYIQKVDTLTGKHTDFISAQRIDLSLHWKALLKGRLVGELIFEQPVLRFTKDKVELNQVARDTADFRQLLEDFMPIKVDRCEIIDGTIRYIDPHSKPAIDLEALYIGAIATNLRNVYDSGSPLPATLTANAQVYDGSFALAMKLNPLSEQPLFELNSTLENVDLTKFNDFFQVYGRFDIDRGKLGLYTEAATEKGAFKGYVKPLVDSLSIVSWSGQDKDDSFFQKLWETGVEFVAELFKNQRKDMLATKIEFSGRFEQPQSDAFSAVMYILYNAFIEALRPALDHEIDLAGLRTERGTVDKPD